MLPASPDASIEEEPAASTSRPPADPAPSTSAGSPLLCLCGCGAELPPERTYFASPDCVGRWAAEHGATGPGRRRVTPLVEPE